MKNYCIGFFSSLFIHSLAFALLWTATPSLLEEKQSLSLDFSTIDLVDSSKEGALDRSSVESQSPPSTISPLDEKDVQSETIETSEDIVEQMEEPKEKEIVHYEQVEEPVVQKKQVSPASKAVDKKPHKKKKVLQEKKQEAKPPLTSQAQPASSGQVLGQRKDKESNSTEKGAEWEQGVAKQYATSNYGYISRRIQGAMQYPSQARRMGWQGVAKIMFTINPDGHVSNIRQLQSSGYQLLDEAGIQAIKDAAPFSPAPPVKAKIIIPLSFKLI